MSRFDNQQSTLLRALAQRRIILHFPLFANTFPLAFHYARALRDIGETTPEAFISYHPWDQGPPEHQDGKTRLFYATKKQLDRQQISTRVHVTLYRPTHFFIDRTARTAYHLHQLGRNGQLRLNHACAEALFSGTRRIEIVSDTPEQADYLRHQLQEHFHRPPVVEIARRQDAIAKVLLAERQSDSRLYFFGAPGTARLLSQTRRFVPIQLNTEAFSRKDYSQEVLDLFDTFCAIGGTELHDDDVQEISTAVDAYHTHLFDAANSKPEAFEEVFIRYNEMAWRLDSIAVFDSAESFAGSISAHHIGNSTRAQTCAPIPTVPVTDSGGSPKDAQRHRHVHFGAGNIGLGLVVPLMHSSTALAILTRDSNKWDRFNGSNDVHGAGVPAEVVVGANTVPVLVIRPKTPDGRDNPHFGGVIDDWKAKGKHILVLTAFDDQVDLITPIIEQAESLSTALGGAQSKVVPIIAQARLPHHPPLLPFENNVLEELKTLDNVEVVTTIIDRICSNVLIEEKDTQTPFRLNVECDEYASVIFGPSANGFPKALASSCGTPFRVQVVETEDHARFFKKRKYWLFNQLHFMLALFAYPYLKKHGYAFGEAPSQALNLALDGMLAEADTDIFIRTTTDLQILRLLLDTRSNVLNDVFEREDMYFFVLELRKYVIEILERIRRRPDQVGRVLSRDRLRENPQKLKDHLNDLKVFLMAHAGNIRDLGIKDCPENIDFDFALQRLIELAQDLALEIQQSRSARARPPV